MTTKDTIPTEKAPPSCLMRPQQDRVTMAQREATAIIERYSNEKGGIRKSKRLLSFLSHPKIKTSKLRRLNELFWFDDGIDRENENENDRHGNDKHDDNINHNNAVDGSVSIKPCCNKSRTNGSGSYYKVSPRLHLKRIHSSPNIYTIENFLTESELIFLDKKIRFANDKCLFHDSFIDGGGLDGEHGQKKAGRKRRRRQQVEEAGSNRLSHVVDQSVPCEGTNDCGNVSCSSSNNNHKNDSNRNNDDVNGNAHNSTCTKTETPEHLSFRNKQDPMQTLEGGGTTKPEFSERTVRQRTSKFIHFTKLSNSVITSIEQRACELLSLPNHCIEPLQLVKYDVGQYFSVHHDLGILYDDGSVELPQRKNVLLSPPRRIVTVLVYLNDVKECNGGSTQFPLLNVHSEEENKNRADDKYHGDEGDNSRGNTCTKNYCGKIGCSNCLEIYPKRGMALIWCNIKKDGTPDERVVHSGQPLVLDETGWKSNSAPVKYVMNIWACED